MYTLKNIKKLFKNNIVLNFALDKSNSYVEESSKKDDFKGDSLQNLKKFKKYLSDGKIDSQEVKIINEHLNDIKEEAKEGLKKIVKEMLKSGIQIENNKNFNKTYNAYKNLIEGKNKGTINFPSIDKIQDTTLLKIYGFNKIIIKSNKLLFKTNKKGFNGLPIYGEFEGNIFRIKGTLKDTKLKDINKDLLKNNINQLEETKQTIKFINKIKSYSIEGKNIKELNKQKIFLQSILKTNKSIEGIIYEAIDKINIKINLLKQQKTTKENLKPSNDKKEIKEKSKKINILKSLVEKNPSLTIENGKVFIIHKTPNRKIHRGYFTINKNPDIKDENSLNNWITFIKNKLDKKYPKKTKIEIKKENHNISTKNLNIKQEIETKKDKNASKEKFETKKQIVEQLKENGIIGNVKIKIDSGDYKGEEFELEFKINGEKLILDSKWYQPGTDKEIKINKNQILNKNSKEIQKYFKGLKNKLILDYKNQVVKEQKPNFNENNDH